jgi:hypothetical protein
MHISLCCLIIFLYLCTRHFTLARYWHQNRLFSWSLAYFTLFAQLVYNSTLLHALYQHSLVSMYVGFLACKACDTASQGTRSISPSSPPRQPQTSQHSFILFLLACCYDRFDGTEFSLLTHFSVSFYAVITLCAVSISFVCHLMPQLSTKFYRKFNQYCVIANGHSLLKRLHAIQLKTQRHYLLRYKYQGSKFEPRILLFILKLTNFSVCY